MLPRRADVGAAMIAHGAKHPGLQISKGHVVGKAASVDLSVVVIRIAAVDEHAGSPEASHIRERHGLVVKRQVRDRPGHPASKRALSGSALVSGPVVSRGRPAKCIDDLRPYLPTETPPDRRRKFTVIQGGKGESN